MANILTTVDLVKEMLEDTAGTSSFDALLGDLILGVSQKFETALNRKLFEAEYTEIHSGGSPRIHVKNPPITEIASITYAPYYDFANGTVLATTEYTVDPTSYANKIYSTFGCFIGGEDMLKVVYTGGYLPADDEDCNIPEIVKQAATMQVVYMFKNRKTFGLDHVKFGDGIIQKVNNKWLLPEVQEVLTQMRYRNI